MPLQARQGARQSIQGALASKFLVARALVDNAIDGDTMAVRECFDRMDGKVPQSSADASNQVRGNVIVWVASFAANAAGTSGA
jgi:hypothetical protein